MKQKFLSILPLLLFSAVMANAQFVETTTYRGAFAPAPVAMWTENWVNWDPQNTFYAAPTVTVNSRITTNTTWTKNNVYLLQGIIYVDSTVTLTIEPGTVIRGDKQTQISSLVISRGATIIANGTACNPIVFTSSEAINQRTKGDWGGLTILGKATSNKGDNVPIEGIQASAPGDNSGRYGGTVNTDNSGILRYIRIEYAGYAIATDNELNSITFGGVGSGTTVDYIQTSFGNDDAFEWFGGTVNCKHLVAYRTLDDDFDTDEGYSGTVQFALAVKDPNVADNNTSSTSEGFESDNNAASPFTILPKTSPTFYNVTQIGAFRCSANTPSVTTPLANPAAFRRGARIRRASEIKIYNSILMNNWRGLITDGDAISAGGFRFQNNIIAMDTTITFAAPYAGLALNAENAATGNFLYAAANTNTTVNTPCDILVNAWDFLNPDYRPNGAGTGAALAGTDLTPSIDLSNGGLFLSNTQAELLVNIFEDNVGNSNGTITVTIPLVDGFPITVPGITTLTSTPQSGTNGTYANGDYFNGDWLFSLVGTNIIATSKVGVKIDKGGATALGFTVRRPATGTPGGTNANLSASVGGGSDRNAANNSTLQGMGANGN
jgi:hypothetical protein